MKNNQKGRSMVEMLGVLAIIGVLSAAGLAGYSKAMFKYKVQKTVDIVMQIFQRYAELELKDTSNIPYGMKKNGLFPECEEVTIDSQYCKLPIGEISDDPVFLNGILTELFWIHFNDSNSCAAFMSYGWDKALPKEWFDPVGFIAIDSNKLHILYGKGDKDDGSLSEGWAQFSDIATACHSNSSPYAVFAIRAGYR